jgi:hypothetical protein
MAIVLCHQGREAVCLKSSHALARNRLREIAFDNKITALKLLIKMARQENPCKTGLP